MKKYELTDETKIVDGRRVYRIRTCRNIIVKGVVVNKGDLGGFVEKERNLPQEEPCWIFDNAVVMDKARVEDSAVIKNNALVKDNACKGNAIIDGHASVGGYVIVEDRGRVTDNAEVRGNLIICDNAIIRLNAKIKGCHIINGDTIVEHI